MLLLLIAIIYFIKSRLYLALPTRNLLKIYIYNKFIYLHTSSRYDSHSHTKSPIFPNRSNGSCTNSDIS